MDELPYHTGGPRRRRRAVAALVVLMAFAPGALGSGATSGAAALAQWLEAFTVDYSLADGDTSPDGSWHCAWTGYGTAGTEPVGDGLVMKLAPAAATSLATTHSTLLLSDSTFRDQRIDLDVRTVSQLRLDRPNPWEVAWVLFRAPSAGNFYYFMVKPNGVEMGMLLDGTHQVILATAETAFLALGEWSHWGISAQGNQFAFDVNGSRVLEYTDRNAPAVLASGAVGLYTEDAYVQFDNVRVTSLESLTNTVAPSTAKRRKQRRVARR